MEKKHFPPAGQSLLGLHQMNEGCICKPTVTKIYKRQTTGKGGSSQGRKVVRIDVIHQVI